MWLRSVARAHSNYHHHHKKASGCGCYDDLRYALACMVMNHFSTTHKKASVSERKAACFSVFNRVVLNELQAFTFRPHGMGQMMPKSRTALRSSLNVPCVDDLKPGGVMILIHYQNRVLGHFCAF